MCRGSRSQHCSGSVPTPRHNPKSPWGGRCFPRTPLTFGTNYCPLVIPTEAGGLQSCPLSLSELIPGVQQKTGHRPKPEHILNWRKNFQLGWRGGIIVPGKPQAEVIHIHLISL